MQPGDIACPQRDKKNPSRGIASLPSAKEEIGVYADLRRALARTANGAILSSSLFFFFFACILLSSPVHSTSSLGTDTTSDPGQRSANGQGKSRFCSIAFERSSGRAVMGRKETRQLDRHSRRALGSLPSRRTRCARAPARKELKRNRLRPESEMEERRGRRAQHPAQFVSLSSPTQLTCFLFPPSQKAMAAAIPQPQPGASLLLAFAFAAPVASASASASTCPPPSPFSSILLLSPSRLSAVRAFAALEAGYTVFVGASSTDTWDAELLSRHASGQVTSVDFPLGPLADEAQWRSWLDGLPAEVRASCMFVVLNDTFPGADSAHHHAKSAGSTGRRSYASALAFRQAANQRRYLVNVADAPLLSDFSWPSSHRFALSTSSTSSATTDTNLKSPLQIAVTTNSSACRLASRLRREIVASLPENVGAGVLAVANLRKELSSGATVKGWREEDGEAVVETSGTGLNRPVAQLSVERSEGLEKVGVEEIAEEDEHGERELSPCRARRASRSAGGDRCVPVPSHSFLP